MKIQESAENYLETILVLSKRKPQVRSIDIAHELSFCGYEKSPPQRIHPYGSGGLHYPYPRRARHC